ncbi:hypothetical protein ACLOJK_020933 [Asimina triloba]
MGELWMIETSKREIVIVVGEKIYDPRRHKGSGLSPVLVSGPEQARPKRSLIGCRRRQQRTSVQQGDNPQSRPTEKTQRPGPGGQLASGVPEMSPAKVSGEIRGAILRVDF